MPGYKLIGQNYTTPDLVAKVTGRARYAEDFRADGMLFCKLLLSPMPHCRVRGVTCKSGRTRGRRVAERRASIAQHVRRLPDFAAPVYDRAV